MCIRDTSGGQWTKIWALYKILSDVTQFQHKQWSFGWHILSIIEREVLKNFIIIVGLAPSPKKLSQLVLKRRCRMDFH